MVNTGRCPECGMTITNVVVEDIAISVQSRSALRGFSYVCPSCRKILAVQVNPLTLNEDLKNEILSALPNP